MFEAKLNENGLGAEYAKGKKYINALKGLDEERVANFRIEMFNNLVIIKRFVSEIIEQFKEMVKNGKYRKKSFQIYVYEKYFFFKSISLDSTYLKEILDRIVRIIIQTDDYEIIEANLMDILSEVNTLTDELCKCFLIEDIPISKEEKSFTQKWKNEEKLYGLYQELNKLFNEAKKIVPSKMSLKEFMPRFEELLDIFENKNGNLWDKFYNLVSKSYIDDGHDLVAVNKELSSFYTLITKIVDDVVRKRYDNPLIRLFNRKECKEYIDTIEREINNSMLSICLSQTIKNDIHRVLTTRKLVNYNFLNDLKYIRTTIDNIMTDYEEKLDSKISARFDKNIEQMPFLILMSDGDKNSLYDMNINNLHTLFVNLNMATMLYLSIVYDSRYISVYTSKYIELSEKARELKSIINQIKSCTTISNFIDYFEYFEYIENGRELSEQEIIDTSLKRLLCNMEEKTATNS